MAHCARAVPYHPESYAGLQQLGDRLLAFYSAANRLYRRSVRGKIPSFFHEYLDTGRARP